MQKHGVHPGESSDPNRRQVLFAAGALAVGPAMRPQDDTGDEKAEFLFVQNAKSATLADGTLECACYYINIPAIHAVIYAANVPPIMARKPYLAKSLRRSGTSPPMPPICTAIEPKLANPQSA